MYKNETHVSFFVTKSFFLSFSALMMFILCLFAWQCSCFVLHLLNTSFFFIFYFLFFYYFFLIPHSSCATLHVVVPCVAPFTLLFL